MPRNISAAALAKIATQQGIEPVTVVAVQWAAGGPISYYSDKDIGATNVFPTILEISDIDDVVSVSLNAQSQKVSVVLSDVDGALKNIIDNNDIHLVTGWIYQFFVGLTWPTDAFVIFRGLINTPIMWNEGDRSVSFDLISLIEDIAVGFSIEAGDFVNPPLNAIGKAWPLVFGQCLNVPCLMLTTPRQGFLTTGVGISDYTLPARIACIQSLPCPTSFAGYTAYYAIPNEPSGLIITPVYAVDPSCVFGHCTEIENLQQQLATQQQFEYNTIQVYCPSSLNQFPTGVVITLDIAGAKFTGTFSNPIADPGFSGQTQTFTITSRLHPNLAHPAVIGPVIVIGGNLEPQNQLVTVEINGSNIEGTFNGDVFTPANLPTAPFSTPPGGLPVVTSLLVITMQLQCAQNWQVAAQNQANYNNQIINNANSTSNIEYRNYLCQQLPTASFFWANQGSVVTMDTDQEIVYIANLLASNVYSVTAIKNYPTGQQLVTVPPEYYFLTLTDYVGYQFVTEIHFPIQLSVIDPTWTDQVFVTLQSAVGPNTVDILEWIISTYTAHSIDSVSFNAVRALVDNYPMHFPLLDRKPVFQVLQEIAYQARCAIFLRDDVFYLIYLSQEPTTTVDTITKSDIDANSLVLSHTPTEEIITEYIATWVVDHSQPNPNEMILRHNVKKYGTLKQGFDFGIKITNFDYYCYNIQELVLKSATYWLIRKSGVWRIISFKTPLHKLNIDVFDYVTINVDHLAPVPVKCMCLKANYNSADNSIDFEFWTPLLSGTQVPYVFAWPATSDPAIIYPTISERFEGFAGSGLGPNFLTVPPFFSLMAPQQPAGIGTGFQLACNGQPVSYDAEGGEHCENDYGDSKPSDSGDKKPEPPPPNGGSADTSGAISTGQGSNTPVPTCCTQAQSTADQALAAAQAAMQAAQQATQGTGDGSNPNDPLTKLPKGGCTPGPCTSVVVTFMATVREVSYPSRLYGPVPGVPPPGLTARSAQAGDTGRIDLIGPPFKKCYTFNTPDGARSFYAQQNADFQNKYASGGFIVGSTDQYTAPSIGTQSSGSGCPPVATPAMTAYNPNG